MKTAFLSGTSIAGSDLFAGWSPRDVSTEWGAVVLREKGNFGVLNRHGESGLTPPHAINHRANIQAIYARGFSEVIAVNSVGSLQESLTPGTLVSCADYVSFQPATFSDEIGRYEAPLIANNLIPEIVAKTGFPIEMGKVYVQTQGPRFETRAEVRIIKNWGDVVGMTLASEADLCREAGLRYNSICMVDNYANGGCDEPISLMKFQALVAENQGPIDQLFAAMLDLFADR